MDAAQYSVIDTFKTFDFSVLPPPPPDLPPPLSRQNECRESRERTQRQLQQLRELHWLHQQRVDALAAHFDPRYDRIAPETASASAAADAASPSHKNKRQLPDKILLPQTRLQRLRAGIRAAYMCKSVLCAHVMQGATLAGLHHPELWSHVDVAPLTATQKMTVGASSAAAGLFAFLPVRTRVCAAALRSGRIAEQARGRRRACDGEGRRREQGLGRAGSVQAKVQGFQ